jgi:hypothetical protein
MGKRWLVNRLRREVLSPLSFTNDSADSIVRYLDQAWLKECEVKEEPLVKPTEKVGFLFWERKDIAGEKKQVGFTRE